MAGSLAALSHLKKYLAKFLYKRVIARMTRTNAGYKTKSAISNDNCNVFITTSVF
jgi:hypothetical protein